MAYTILEKRVLLLGCLLSVIVALSADRAKAQAPGFFLFDHPVHETWYKKALDACMQSWGDLRDMGVRQEEVSSAPGVGCGHASKPKVEEGRELMIIDAAVGRLHFADLCLKNLCAKPTELASDDIWYLWRIMHEFDAVCAKLEHNILYKARTECVRAAAQQVRDRLAKYSYTADEAFFYKDNSYKDNSMPQPNS
jgi:hypothetical protein